MGQNPPHANAIRHCVARLRKIFGGDLVECQLPIEAASVDREYSLPEPDVAVLAEAQSDLSSRHPTGRELSLLIEVSDTTLRYDTTTKRDLYARAGVPEYWVLDLNSRRLLVHRDLNSEAGQYTSIQSVGEEEAVAIDSHPGEAISVAALLP
jgi:Uma2 family endonuclease